MVARPIDVLAGRTQVQDEDNIPYDDDPACNALFQAARELRDRGMVLRSEADDFRKRARRLDGQAAEKETSLGRLLEVIEVLWSRRR